MAFPHFDRRSFFKQLIVVGAFALLPAIPQRDEVAEAVEWARFGDGSDGDVTITGTVELRRNMYFRNLTLGPDAKIIHNGYRTNVSNYLHL